MINPLQTHTGRLGNGDRVKSDGPSVITRSDVAGALEGEAHGQLPIGGAGSSPFSKLQ